MAIVAVAAEFREGPGGYVLTALLRVVSHLYSLILSTSLKDCCVRVWVALHPASIIHSLYSSVCSVLPDTEIFPALKSVSYTDKYLH